MQAVSAGGGRQDSGATRWPHPVLASATRSLEEELELIQRGDTEAMWHKHTHLNREQGYSDMRDVKE